MALSIILSGCAGMEPVTEKDATFERVIEVPGVKKDRIYSKTIQVSHNYLFSIISLILNGI